MKKIISAGHLCLDITPVFPEGQTYKSVGELLVPGQLVHTKDVSFCTGGSVGNTGLALKILGAEVSLMGKVGDDAFGAVVQGIAAKYGAGGFLVDKDSTTSYTMVLAIPGIDRLFLHCPGANDTFSQADIPEEALEDAALFHFGYPPLMRRMFLEEGEELVQMFRRMKEKGIATSLDLAAVDRKSESGEADWKRILTRVLPYVDFFVPSYEELCLMLDPQRYLKLSAMPGDITERLSLERDVAPLLDTLMEMGCKVVMIKCGTSGICYRTAGRECLQKVGARLGLDLEAWSSKRGYQPCFEVEEVLSGTGAGDTCIAAFLMGVLEGKDPEKCVQLAAAEGACSVTAYDTLSALKTLPELEERINQGWKTIKVG